MDRPMTRKLPQVPISGLPRKTPSHLERVTVRDPKTGKTQTHSRQNATDLVRHNGWIFINTATNKEEITLADGRKVTGEDHGDAKAQASEEARADDKQDVAPDAPEVGGAPASDAEGVGRVQSDEAESDKEVGSKLDQLRAEAEGLGVKVDKRWGSKRLKKEIANNTDNAL